VKYVELKAVIAAAEEKHGLDVLDLSSREILNHIANANLLKQKIMVSDIKNKERFGTHPTIINKLNKLAKGGWIERYKDETDKRVVLLRVTPKARTVFKRLSNALEAH
jgi:DNA-binding MarR family transcriptional regulator